MHRFFIMHTFHLSAWISKSFQVLFPDFLKLLCVRGKFLKTGDTGPQGRPEEEQETVDQAPGTGPEPALHTRNHSHSSGRAGGGLTLLGGAEGLLCARYARGHLHLSPLTLPATLAGAYSSCTFYRHVARAARLATADLSGSKNKPANKSVDMLGATQQVL